MKKIIAILLVLVMVLPMCFVAQAEEAKTDVKPFYLINWSPIDESVKEDNLYPLFYLWTRKPNADAKELYVNAPHHGVGNNIEAIAAAMKEDFDARPVGARVLLFTTHMDANLENHAFLDKGMNLCKDYLEKLFSAYKAIGGVLDGMVIDMEYNDYGSYYLDKAALDDPFVYKNIVDDPRYSERIRPALVERGFKFWEDTSDYKPEIYSINSNAGAEYAQSRSVWDSVVRELMVWYMNEGCSPLFKYYPDATLSNYRSYAAKGWLKTLDNRGGYSTGGNLSYVGNTTNENAYFYKPADAFFKASSTSAPTFNYPVGYNNSLLEATKFNTFLWDMHVFKNMMQASDTENMTPWITGYNYSQNDYSGSNSPYYSETLFHIGLMNPLFFAGYIVPDQCDGKYDTALKIVSDILHELTRVAGAADRKYINLPHDWNRGFGLTGMYAGGKNIWRITPDITGDMTLEKFKVEGAADPTFYINGQTVTFPNGKIIETGEISVVGSCGYWVETPADVMPIITSDVDRYRMFPAFLEDFNGYETGMEYTYNNVEFVTSWQVKKGKTATAVVQEDKDNAGNKVLALTGDFTLKNVKVTENVTAGDTYAENQAWEVTVTVPANMGAEAEIILLAIYGDKNAPIDGGFKVAGGKLYYYNADKYVEFEGVDVSAGGKFVLKRDMDFNTADAFTCDYTVYDSTGKELATVKDIPVAKDVKVPIQSIGIDCSDIAGDPVLLDDYKLYASGVATDLELYDATLGLKVDEVDKARAANTAYRLSWINATAYDKVYSVVAAYYNGDTLVSEKVIKELKMAPNTDAIETGVVEVENGQSVRVYVRNDSQPEPGEVPVMLIAIIAGAVVLVAVIVAVIVVASKKKKATPATEESEDKTAE